MKTTFYLVSLIFFSAFVYLFWKNEYLESEKFCVFLLFSLFMAFLDEIVKYIKKIKIRDNEIEFKNEHNDAISNEAFNLLNNNFPKLNKKANKEITQRVNAWLKLFNNRLKKEQISKEKINTLYEPSFLFVLNKSVELVGRKNNKFLNNLLITYLIKRLKMDNTDSYVSYIDDIIVHSAEYLTEKHLDLICLIHLLEKIKQFFPQINNVNEFKDKVLNTLNCFMIDDFSCYGDLLKLSFINNTGNWYLMFPKEEDRDVYFSSVKGGKLQRPPMKKGSLLEYFCDLYPNIINFTEEEKQSIKNNDVYNKLNEIYIRNLIWTNILPIAEISAQDYFNAKYQNLNLK